MKGRYYPVDYEHGTTIGFGSKLDYVLSWRKIFFYCSPLNFETGPNRVSLGEMKHFGTRQRAATLWSHNLQMLKILSYCMALPISNQNAM